MSESRLSSLSGSAWNDFQTLPLVRRVSVDFTTQITASNVQFCSVAIKIVSGINGWAYHLPVSCINCLCTRRLAKWMEIELDELSSCKIDTNVCWLWWVAIHLHATANGFNQLGCLCDLRNWIKPKFCLRESRRLDCWVGSNLISKFNWAALSFLRRTS